MLVSTHRQEIHIHTIRNRARERERELEYKLFHNHWYYLRTAILRKLLLVYAHFSMFNDRSPLASFSVISQVVTFLKISRRLNCFFFK